MNNSFTNFKDLGITVKHNSFTGDKIKIGKVLNKQIAIHDYRITDSNFKGKRLDLSIELNGKRHVLFTGSVTLMDMIEQVPREKLPIVTTIVEENERYQFT